MSGYFEQLKHSRSNMDSLQSLKIRAMREKRFIVQRVILADDTIATVQAGPRGGHKILARM